MSAGTEPHPALQRALPWILMAALAVYALLLILHFFGAEVQLFDDSILLVNSMQVHRGRIPHVDFWTSYTPLAYYLSSLMFSVFGMTVMAVRLLQSLFYIGFIVAYALFLRSFRGLSRLAKILLTLGTVVLTGLTFTQPWWMAYTFCFIGMLIYVQAVHFPSKRRMLLLALSGVAVALGCLSRLSFGGYVVVAVVLDTLLQLSRRFASESGPIGARQCLARLLVFGAPLAVGLAVYLLPYGSRMGQVLDQLLAVSKQMGYRAYPLRLNPQFILALLFPLLWFAARGARGGLKGRPFAAGLSLLALVLAVVFLYAGNWRLQVLRHTFVLTAAGLMAMQAASRRLRGGELAVLLCYSMFLHYFLSRADQFHVTPLFGFACLLVPFAMEGVSRKMGGLSAVRAVGALSLVAALSLLQADWGPYVPRASRVLDGFRLAVTRRTLWGQGDSAYLMNLRGPVARPESTVYPNDTERSVLQYVYRMTKPDEAVFVGVMDHSWGELNALRFYWTLGRPVGVKHHEFEPGLTTGLAAQQQMAADLDRRRVNCLILTDNYQVFRAPEVGTYPKSNYLDQYIRANYHEDETFARHRMPRYHILVRNDAARSLAPSGGENGGSAR